MTYEENGFFYWKTKVYSYQLDQQKRISPIAIAEILQEVAGTHANSFGFGYNDVVKHNLVWVITAMRFEIENYPVWDEEITIKTWIVNINRFLSNRHFQILNNKGEVLISASTIWLLYNFVKRRPQMIADMNFDVTLHPESVSVKNAISISKNTVDEGKISNYTVQYSDLDMVGHMNNTRYFRSIIDTYSYDFHKTHNLKSFEIQFRKEAIINDNLEITSQELTKNTYHHEIKRKDDGKSNCYCSLEWTNSNDE